jgi:hypothetical protein
MVQENTGFAMLDGKRHGPMLRIDHNYDMKAIRSLHEVKRQKGKKLLGMRN